MSRSNVSSTEIETRSVSSSRSRGSIPQRTVAQQRADRPGQDDAELRIRRARRESPTVFTPAAARRCSAFGPTPGSARTGNGARKRASFPGGTTVIPPGLRRSEATLQTTFDVETPSEQESDVAARTEVCTASATARAPVNDGDDGAEVEVALVDPHLLDPRHDLADRAPDRLRVLPVERVARPDEHDVGAASERLGRAHRRADAEAPGDVVRGRDDAATLRVAADDERLRRAARVLELLDGGEERVEVEMGEDRHAANATVPP